MRRFTIAALVCLLLTIVHTWPIGAAPHRHSLNYNADAELTAWIVSWIAYALPHDPAHLFAGNIFQPDARVLAYSEPLLVPALLGAPVRWSGGSAVLTNNLLLMPPSATDLFSSMLVAILALLPIVNPLGSAPIFLSMSADLPGDSRRILSRQVGINAFILLSAAMLIGSHVLKFFGISIPVVRVGGGLLLMAPDSGREHQSRQGLHDTARGSRAARPHHPRRPPGHRR